VRLQTELLPLSTVGYRTIWDAVFACIAKVRTSGKAILRWGLVSVSGQEALLEIASISDVSVQPEAQLAAIKESARGGIYVALVVPTGVGAAIGGFIGDAGPVARALESVADLVILHPNVVNAADFYAGGDRSLYVDGLTLDRFFAGEVQLGALRRVKSGLILDRLDASCHSQVLNAANGLRAAHGIDFAGYVVCEEKIRCRISRSRFGHYTGDVENPEVLFRAAEILRRHGANALAVVSGISGISGITEEDLARHYSGVGPNPVGALEALISRSITWRTGLPCAHAPAFSDGLGKSSTIVDPRAASEVASGSGLPCVIYGLTHAPQIVKDGIAVSDLAAVIVPLSCAGGAPALAAKRFGVSLIAVKANTTAIGVSAELLDIDTTIVLENYAEAIAFIACRKSGVSWESILRPLESTKELKTPAVPA
jgi:hypothetical protein